MSVFAKGEGEKYFCLYALTSFTSFIYIVLKFIKQSSQYGD
jgi:hypothetical protein